MLARVFLDDGSRESDECDSNYFYFDAANQELEKKIFAVLRDLDTDNFHKRKLLRQLCDESLIDKLSTRKISIASELYRGYLAQITYFCNRLMAIGGRQRAR